MSWKNNEHSLLDLDDSSTPASNRPARPYQPTPPQDDPFSSNRPSISYDDFAGQSSSNRPYPAEQSASSHSLGTVGTSSGMYHQPSFFDDTFNDDSVLIDRNSQRNRRSHRESGGGIGALIGRMTGGRIGPKQPDMSDMDLPLTQTGVAPAGTQANIQQPGQPVQPVADDSSEHSRESSRWKFSDFHFGRAPPDPSTLGPRIIHLNDSPANAAKKFIDNHVSTAKYNIATFLPKFLFEQFSKYANLFFLFTAIIQQVPNVSPTNRYTTIGPLAVVLLVSAIKEAIEDVKRHNSDTELNRSKAEILQGGDWVLKKWYQIRVGDIIRVTSGKPIPADLILLASSEPEGLCYIETANLDGETNLKIKQALPETAGILSPGVLCRVQGTIKSEQPNNHLYTYEGTLTIDTGGGEKEIPLSPDQMLLRGATLRNTPWIHGVVIFTGHETKLMQNATAAPIKRTALENMVNLQIIFLFIVLIVLCVVSTTGQIIKDFAFGSTLGYLDFGGTNAISTFFLDLLTFWILYSNLIPISLFVTIELVKYVQAFLINCDMDIYHPETDTPAVCRTSSLVEELGQIEYIFSDKTGTLTCNQMQFRQCSIGGIQYGDQVPEDRRARVIDGVEDGIFTFDRLRENIKGQNGLLIKEFLTLLATCHTVIPERVEEKPGEITYQAASPDEGALVEGASMLGFKFTTRRPKSVNVLVDGEGENEYEVLNICEFNSTRKRMSAILRCPDGKIRIYCKGADTVILERLARNNPYVDLTTQHLEDYATEGLRTLCLAIREVPEDEYRQWSAIYEKAATTINNRSEELDKAAELIEREFFLVGATAIEDRLQDGVPETIHTLQTAGIKVWVLTGDRQETAINIGLSCKLISEDMNLLIINEESKAATRDSLVKKLEAIRGQKDQNTEMDVLALVIDGKSLTYALEKDLEKSFLDLAVMCKALICCRVSPLQKALVVKLVKRHLKAILLAIGDGANDVGMIQAAHVGVGISGVEGLQAARSADVAIAQFRFLQKLLLVHGTWSYHRLSKLILYSYYKNLALAMTQFWYVFQNAFSGQTIFESWTLSFYNVFFTFLPPFAIGVFDQFISARLLDRYPQLYRHGQKGEWFNIRTFWAWIINGFYHSAIGYIVSTHIFIFDGVESDGQLAGQWVWGTALYTAMLLTVLGKAALITNLWTKWTIFAIPGSFVIWMIFLPVYAIVAPKLNFSTEYEGILPHLYPTILFWSAIVMIPVMCLIRDFGWKYYRRMYLPKDYHYVQEIQKFNVADYRPRMEQFQKAIRKVRQVQRMRKQRGYAFSQGDEGQMRLIRAYDTTQNRGKYGEMRAVPHAGQQNRGLGGYT